MMPDVRTVIHFDTPDCMESYYQRRVVAGETGKSLCGFSVSEENITGLKTMPDRRFVIPEIKEFISRWPIIYRYRLEMAKDSIMILTCSPL